MEPGEKIRDYVLQRRIGSGGVGEVWRAVHTRLNRTVAIKVILSHLGRDQDVHNRFLQEAVAMASLEHPHILTVHDFFSVGAGAYLVMPYIEGGSLQERLSRDGPLSVKDALRISGGILDALDFAHQKGVIHRDVKPSNILLTSNLHAYLVDFGIALVLGKARVTKFGTSVGTPEYMSPEQIRGGDLDHKTDVYSFGCVFYEMLAGRPPFGTVEEATEFTIMERHIKDRPAPLRDLSSAVDEQTESAVLRAMAKDQNERFDGCAEMSKALASRFSEVPRRHGQTSLTHRLAFSVLVASTLISLGGWMTTCSKIKDLELRYSSQSPTIETGQTEEKKIAVQSKTLSEESSKNLPEATPK